MSSGLVQTGSSPNPVFPYGESIVTSGLQNRGVINGYALVTRGFLNQLYDIWFDNEFFASITSVWTSADSVITTSWSNSDATITTTWVDMQFGTSGEYTP